MRRPLRGFLYLTILSIFPAAAWAGGFTYPDHGAHALSRGGAFTARADDPSAIIYNPGALARLKGTHILLGGNIIWEDIRYQRLAYDEKTGNLSDRYPHNNALRMPEIQNDNPALLTPILGLSTDLGLDLLDRINLKVLAGVYGPHTHNRRTYPRYCKKEVSPCEVVDADDGDGVPSPARYDTNFIDMLVIYPSLGLAWEPLPGVRIGGVFQVVYTKESFDTVVSSILAKPKTPEDPFSDLDIHVEAEDVFTPTGILGIHVSPLDFLEIGASVRIGFPMDSKGTVLVDSKMNLHTLVDPNPAEITIRWRMPWVVRTGARFINRDEKDRERFDVELDFIWESTGEMDEFDIETKAKFGTTSFSGLEQVHSWKDTWSLRVGGSYQLYEVIPRGVLRFSAGGFYESETMPEGYSRLDFLALARWGLSVGVGASWRWLSLTVGYSHIFHDSRSEERSEVKQMTPLAPNVGSTTTDGNYSVNIDILMIGLGVSFGGGEESSKPTCTLCP